MEGALGSPTGPATRFAVFGDTYLLRLERGEEVFRGISEFAAAQGIEAAAVSGIGAARDVVLGYYDLAAREYVRKSLAEEMEIVSLVGNVSLREGRPFPHLHAVLSTRDFGVLGGHFFEGKVTGTCELVIRRLSGAVRRRMDDETGLYLLDI